MVERLETKTTLGGFEVKSIQTLFLLTILVLTGCATGGPVSSSYQLSDSTDSIVVIGTNFPFQMSFYANTAKYVTFRGKPKNGYFVFRSPPNQKIALQEIEIPKTILGTLCGDARSISFDVPESKIIYIGHIDELSTELFEKTQTKLIDITIKKDIKSAQAHLKEFYPNLTEPLVDWSYEPNKAFKCVRTRHPSFIYP